MACPCPCCGKTGACCVGATCTQETCTDCEALGGLWQGYDTECDGSDCPCDPPADHTLCEKCVDGVPEDRCGPGENCCDGVCQEEACDGGACFEWHVTVSGGDFGTHTFSSTLAADQCYCGEAGDAYEIGLDTVLSTDETTILSISGSVNVICVDGDCEVQDGSFGLTVADASDSSVVCDGNYYSTTSSGGPISVPYTVTFTQDDDACDAYVGTVTITCVFNGPFQDCNPLP